MRWFSKKHVSNPYEVSLEYDVEKELLKNGSSLAMIKRHFGKNNEPFYTALPIDSVQMEVNKK